MTFFMTKNLFLCASKFTYSRNVNVNSIVIVGEWVSRHRAVCSADTRPEYTSANEHPLSLLISSQHRVTAITATLAPGHCFLLTHTCRIAHEIDRVETETELFNVGQKRSATSTLPGWGTQSQLQLSRLELQTKVKQSFAKVSQSRRRPLLGLSPNFMST